MLGLFAVALYAYRPLLFGEVLAGRDAFRLFIPDTAFLLECVSRFELPLWNPYQRLGQPFLATLQSQAAYPLRILPALLFGHLRALSVEQVLHALVAAAGTFVFCRAIGARRWPAWIAGGAFGFGQLFTHLAIQQNVVSAASWTGFILAGALGVARRPSLRSAAALALPLGLSVLAGSPESLLWQLPLAVACVACRGLRRTAVPLALAMAWGGALGAVSLLPGAEFALNSARSAGAWGTLEWSVPPVTALSMAWLQADFPRPTVWGDEQSFVLLPFQGTLVCALAAVAALRRPRLRPRTVLAVAGVLLLALSLGKHFAPAAWLLDVPPFRFFRYPAKYLVGAGFCLSALAALGLGRLSAWAQRRPASRHAAFLALVGVAVAIVAGMPLVRAVGMREGAAPGLAWGAIFLGGVLASAFIARAPRRRWKVLGGGSALVALEVLAAHAVLEQPAWRPIAELAAPSPLAAAIPSDYRGRFSAEFAPPEEEKTSLVARSRPVLEPLRNVEEKLRAVEGYGAPEPQRIEEALQGQPRGIYDLAGAAYFVRRGGPPFPDAEPVVQPEGLPGLYKTSTALPRAFVVHEAEVASDDVARAALADPSQPFRSRAFLAGGEALARSAACASSATWTEERFTRVSIAVNACAPAVVVVTDAHYPGWEAELDGAPVPLQGANFLVKAVAVPAGQHQVLLAYRPWSFRIGATLSALAALGVVLAFRRKT